MSRKIKIIITFLAMSFLLLLFFYLKNNKRGLFYNSQHRVLLNVNEYIINDQVYDDISFLDSVFHLECNYMREFLLHSKDTLFFYENYQKVIFYRDDSDYSYKIPNCEIDNLSKGFLNGYNNSLKKYFINNNIQKIKLKISLPILLKDVGVPPPSKHYGNNDEGVIPICSK